MMTNFLSRRGQESSIDSGPERCKRRLKCDESEVERDQAGLRSCLLA